MFTKVWHFEYVILVGIKINNNNNVFYIFSEDILCDIKLETDDGTIICGHKVILVSACPYFHAMFTSFAQGAKYVVKIRELDSNILQLLIDYIYTGKIMVTEQNVIVGI